MFLSRVAFSSKGRERARASAPFCTRLSCKIVVGTLITLRVHASTTCVSSNTSVFLGVSGSYLDVLYEWHHFLHVALEAVDRLQSCQHFLIWR